MIFGIYVFCSFGLAFTASDVLAVMLLDFGLTNILCSTDFDFSFVSITVLLQKKTEHPTCHRLIFASWIMHHRRSGQRSALDLCLEMDSSWPILYGAELHVGLGPHYPSQ